MTVASNVGGALPPVVWQRILALSGALASASSLEQARRALVRATAELAAADDAACVFVDAERGELWTEAGAWSWQSGLAGAAARTGSTIMVSRTDRDPRYRANADIVGAGPRERLVAVPVVGSDGQTHAVLLASRRATQPAFDSTTARALQELGVRAVPMLQHVQDVLANREDVSTPVGPFRPQALEALSEPQYGRVVRTTPPWLGVTFWLVCALVAVGLAFISLASKHRYSTGPGIVRDGRRHAVVSHQTGTVRAVEVAVGERVEAGQPLVFLDSALLRGDLQRAHAELQRRVRQHLLDPDDDGGADAVATVLERIEALGARLREREILAPSAGIIADLRVRPGRPIVTGDVVATIDTGQGTLQLLAFLPGGDRPGIAAGMQMRLEIPGYRHEYQWLEITSVEDGAVGPDEAARLVGSEHADSVTLSGPTVLVEATLPQGFAADDRTYAYHDGMLGRAEVRLRKRRLLFLLFPFLEEVLQ